MRIKELRERLGLTQEQLAGKLGGSILWIKALEAGSNLGSGYEVFTEQMIRELASALDCTVGELFDEPIETDLASLIDLDRFEKVQAVIEKSANLSTQNQESADIVKALLKGFEKSLTIAEIAMLSLSFTKKSPTEADLEQVVEYLKVLKALSVPIAIPLKHFTAEQLVLQEGAEEFLKSLNQFRADWAKANANAIKSQTSDEATP